MVFHICANLRIDNSAKFTDLNLVKLTSMNSVKFNSFKFNAIIRWLVASKTHYRTGHLAIFQTWLPHVTAFEIMFLILKVG